MNMCMCACMRSCVLVDPYFDTTHIHMHIVCHTIKPFKILSFLIFYLLLRTVCNMAKFVTFRQCQLFIVSVNTYAKEACKQTLDLQTIL